MTIPVVLIIAFILLVIVRANNTKINVWTVLLCLAILNSTTFIITKLIFFPGYFADTSDLHFAFILIAPPVAIIALAFLIGKKLR